MQINSSRKEILERIATATSRRSAIVEENSFDKEAIYKPVSSDAVGCFVQELEAVSGQCVLCENETQMYIQLRQFLENKNIQSVSCREQFIRHQLENYKIHCDGLAELNLDMEVGITSCEYIIARTGSVLVSSNSASGRQMTVFPPTHIVLAHVSQLVDFPEDALVSLQHKYSDGLPSMITTITGPSRTADIEKTLVLGAHGPKEFIVFLSKD